MPAQVFQLDDYRKRVTMRTQDGRVHEMPVSVWHDIAAGKRTVDDLGGERDGLVRLIVAEWLASLGYAEAIELLEMKQEPG